MNRLSQEALTRLVIALIGLIVGLLDFLIKRPDISESIFRAFVVAAMLFACELILEVRDAQKLGNKNYNDFVHRNRNLTGSLLLQLNLELEQSIKVHEHQFAVEHETLAILSYDSFWKQLVEQMEKHSKLTVYIIHSCAIDVWVDHPLTKSLLNRQRDFCQKGGKIIRILCAREPEHVYAAAEKMAEVGIELKYYNPLSNKILDHDFAWDFAVVAETGDAAIWDSFANRPGGVIGEAVYLNRGEFKGKKLKDLWDKVASASESISITPALPANNNN